MSEGTLSKRSGYLGLGCAGLLFSMWYLAVALQMPFGSMSMPGPALFPIFCGAMLALASLAAIWEGWRMSAGERAAYPTGANLKRLLLLLGAMLVYLVALPWLGQLVSSVIFCALMLRLVSSLGWMRIAAYSLAICIVLYVVFISYLKVSMPSRVLGF